MGEYGSKVCYKMVVLFVVMIAGYIAKKAKIVDKNSTKVLNCPSLCRQHKKNHYGSKY